MRTLSPSGECAVVSARRRIPINARRTIKGCRAAFPNPPDCEIVEPFGRHGALVVQGRARRAGNRSPRALQEARIRLAENPGVCRAARAQKAVRRVEARGMRRRKVAAMVYEFKPKKVRKGFI